MGYQDRAPDLPGRSGRSGGLVIVDGIVRDGRVKQHLIQNINMGPLLAINAIVVHQTDSYNASGTLTWWEKTPKHTGAHFLIDKDGTVTQTVPLTRKCWHVGPIYSRCYSIHKCAKGEEKSYEDLSRSVGGDKNMPISYFARELRKKYPDRYPSNSDSVGIEIVSKSLGAKDINPSESFEPLTKQQQSSLQWLVTGLLGSLKLNQTDIYRHGSIAAKMKGEGRDADWNVPSSRVTP